MPEPSMDEVERFKTLRKEFSISPVFVHCSYLINLSSPDTGVRDRSIALLCYELRVLQLIGADYLVLHPGRAVDQPVKDAITKASEAIKEATKRTGIKKRILLENTAGQKGDISSSMRNLAAIAELAGDDSIGGLCIDTCHAYQAGYNITKIQGCNMLFEEVKKYLSPLKIKLIHLNDSKQPFTSGVDRHEHIGVGHIGLHGFRVFLAYPETKGIPIVLETPKKSDKDDIKNLNKLKLLLEEIEAN